tara:strand:+ start:2120 stop:2554 length:435 start_codon:yes stop_codon:yes gene_type:complete
MTSAVKAKDLRQHSKKQPLHRIEDGWYSVKLKDITYNFHPAYGKRWQFIFEFPCGKTLMRTTSPSLGIGSARRMIMEALFERETDMVGEIPLQNVEDSYLVGKKCQALVVNTKNKHGVEFSNIESVYKPVPKGSAEIHLIKKPK